MTDACETQHGQPVPANGNPCQECPFRKSNTGREHPRDFYRPDQFASEWRRVSDGDFFACHIMAPDLHPHDERSKAAGYVTPIETGSRPECAGSALAIQREIELAATYATLEAYKAARPAGLSLDAFARIAARIDGTAQPAFKVPAKFDIGRIKDPAEEIDTTSPIWAFGDSMDSLMGVIDSIIGPAPCSCPVCTNHEDLHSAEEIVTADGGPARVDQTLAGLLTAMNRAGIRTTDSCQNLAEAVKTLWPEMLEALNRETPGRVSYAEVIRTGNAFIRMHVTNHPEKEFLRQAEPHATVQTAAGIAQLSFDLGSVPALMLITESLRA